MPFDGNKRNHVGRAHARVRARLPRQVNQLSGFAYAAHRRLTDCVGFANQRDHAAIVVRVAFPAEQIHAGDRAHGVHDGVYLRQLAAFGKIRNALDELLHGSAFLGVDDRAAFHRQAAEVHAKIIRNFAIARHVKRSEVRILANLERADAVMLAERVGGIDRRGGNGFGGSHAHLRASERQESSAC